MKTNVKTFPCRNCTDACYCEDPKEWIEEFEKELREKLRSLLVDPTRRATIQIQDLKEIWGE